MGRDILRVGGNGYVDAGEGADDIAYIGEGGEPYIEAREGNDKISLRGTGSSASSPGSGDDTVVGGQGNDSVYEDSGGTDTIRTYAGDDYISWIAQRDQVRMGSGNDRLVFGSDGVNESPSQAYAGAGDDQALFYFWPTEVTDAFVDGGPGQDTLWFDWLGVEGSGEAGPGMIVDLTAGTATHDGNAYVVPSFDNVIGSHLHDEMYGDSSGNTFFGRSGGDILVGEGGGDVLVGEGGRDSANGGPGTDRCDTEITVDCEEKRTE